VKANCLTQALLNTHEYSAACSTAQVRFSAKRREVMPENQPQHRILKFDKYLVNGKQTKREDAVKYPVMAAVEGLSDEAAIHAFDSQQAFVKWSEKTKHAEKIAGAIEAIEAVRQYKQKDNTVAKGRQKKLAQRILEDLEELSKRTGLPISSTELLMKASEDSPLPEGRIFNHSAVLWEQSRGMGAAWPSFGVPYPDLNWFQWGNRAASINVNGHAYLYDQPWYSGQMIFLSAAFWSLFELASFNFQFRTESMFS
jgi:hypothetical protein